MTSKHKTNLKSQTTGININLLAQFLPVLVSSTRSILHRTLMQKRAILSFMTKTYTKAATTIKRHQITCATWKTQFRLTENTFVLLCFYIYLLPLSEGGRGSRVTKQERSARRLEGCGIMKVLVVIIAQVCCVTEALCGRG